MGTLLIHNARAIATFDAAAIDHTAKVQSTELRDASIYIEGNRIAFIGATADLPAHALQADEVIDACHHLVTPGLVNTHHHMYQSLTRAIPQVQDAELFGWLRGLYPIWAGLTPEMVQVSTQIAMAELLLSGCTTSSDHLYIYPNGVRLDDSIGAAAEIGMRFVATRGSMSVGQSQGGLPPDRVVEKEDFILKESQRLIERHHDASFGSMLNVALAPCSPFSVSRDLMRETALLARSLSKGMNGQGVRLHTHLAENDHDLAYSREKFGCTPTQYARPGLAGPRCVARALRQTRRRRHQPVCRQPHRRGALPLQQYAPGQRHSAHPQDAQRRRARGSGRGRQRQQRRGAHGERSPPGAAAGPRGPGHAAARRAHPAQR